LIGGDGRTSYDNDPQSGVSIIPGEGVVYQASGPAARAWWADPAACSKQGLQEGLNDVVAP
jgi:hypothetical protein